MEKIFKSTGSYEDTHADVTNLKNNLHPIRGKTQDVHPHSITQAIYNHNVAVARDMCTALSVCGMADTMAASRKRFSNIPSGLLVADGL